MIRKNFYFLFMLFSSIIVSYSSLSASSKITYPEQNWKFSGVFGTFDKGSAQRGFQVYREVCSGCHGMRLLSYRHLSALGYKFLLEQ